MSIDSSGLQVLERDECLRLLSTVTIGRVAFTVDALPALQPVTFALDDGHVVIRSLHGSKLVAGIRDAIVAFEADDYDDATHTGWSVTVVGPASPANTAQLIERLSRLPLRRWGPAEREQFVRIEISVIHGRRISTNGSGPLRPTATDRD